MADPEGAEGNEFHAQGRKRSMPGPQPSANPSDAPTPAPSASAAERILAPGTVLGGAFEIDSVAGRGGMAVVYHGMQKSLRRPVAIKVLHDRFARDAQFVSRFEAESGALAALAHPNIVSIIDRGADQGVYYFVMEFVDGETLDLRIVHDTSTRELWQEVIVSCGAALEYVHRRRVVHRDIKASNILIDRENRVKIGDFGIAHIVGGDEGEAAQITSPGKAVGTAAYMAPEQTADPSSVDHRADIYSLGVTYYKMLTRRLPTGVFPPPSEVNREVPVAVDEVIFRATCPDRDERYQSVSDFTEAMLAALRKRSVSMASAFSSRRSATSSSALYTGTDFSRAAATRTPPPPGEPAHAKQKVDASSPPRISKADLLRLSSSLTKMPSDLRTPAPEGGTPSSDEVRKPGGLGAAIRRLWKSDSDSRG